MSNELKFLLSWKPIPHFLIISVRRASLLPWKYLLVEEKKKFLFMESVQISPRGFVCEREESWY